MSSKRVRKHSDTPSDATSESQDPQVSAKVPRTTRTSPKASRGPPSLTCSLPPSCSLPNSPTVLTNSEEMEQHHATYHTHVCTAPDPDTSLGVQRSRPRECGKVFPDERFLDLHLSECHDPMVTIRQERGEKTASCEGKFLTPKARRLHLIDVHSYPKEYFFSVTTKGISGLLQKWGGAASLLRREWKPRAGQVPSDDTKDQMEAETLDSTEGKTPLDSKGIPPHLRNAPKTAEGNASSVTSSSAKDFNLVSRSGNKTLPKKNPGWKEKISTKDPSVDSLASSLDALSLIPPSIRFGRGGRTLGFVGPGRNSKQKEAKITEKEKINSSDTNVEPRKQVVQSVS